MGKAKKILFVSTGLLAIISLYRIAKARSWYRPIRKVDPIISSPFGMRTHPITGIKSMHNGIDIVEPKGTPVYSPMRGRVEVASMNSTSGNYIVIKHTNGYSTHYAHLDTKDVVSGQVVKRGDKIGTVGNTGRSTGNHLHLGMKNEKGSHIDPFPILYG